MRHALFLLLILAAIPAIAASKLKKPAGKPPKITEPALFNTPESDAILAKLQIFPADNAYHADISRWPVHPASRALVGGMGPGKP